MLSNLFYYMFYASAVFVYGMGTTSAIQSSIKPKNLFLQFSKIMILVIATLVFTYLLTVQLIKINLGELSPFICVAMFALVSFLVENFLRFYSKTTVAEYGVSILCILIAVIESVSFLDCLVNAIACLLSFFVSVPIMHAIRKKIEINAPSEKLKNLGLLFISIGVLTIILLSWGVSWLNPGVLSR
ncbi:MAG: hypothetical protein J6Y69_11210 [Treponema sp.]|nr:hypothetical protein [Treponema sp.]